MQLKQVICIMSVGVMLFSFEAQAEGLQFNDVLQAAFKHHPDLKASQLKIESSMLNGQLIEGVLDTRYGGRLGVSDESSPTTNGFSASQSNIAFLSGQVAQPFADGSTLTATLNYNRAELTYPSAVPAAFQSNPNPVFKHQIDLIYRYPLASGAGNPSYQLQKTANVHELKAAELGVLLLREQLANQAISFYFQLVLSDLSVKIADDAVVRAKQLLSYQKKREQFGLIEKAERLQAEALLAMRQLQLVQAVATRDMAQTSLNRFMFSESDLPLKPMVTPIQMAHDSIDRLLAKAESNRPVFAVLMAQYAAAELRLELAQEKDEYQLDLVGQVGSRALDGSAGTAFGQGFTLNDRYIGLQLEFSDVWSHTAGRAAIQQAVLALENIKVERLKMVENLKSELANVYAQLQNGEVILKASKHQVEAEKEKYNAEMAKYREGRSTTAIVTQFEGDLRAAELRVLIQQVSLQQATYQLALAQGELPAVFGDKQ